jgi:hypothetical protein
MVGPTVGILRCDVRDMPTVAQGALLDMPQSADFGGFFSVPDAICQRSPKLLREVPRITKGLDAE